jgi:hypothetical protein
MRTRIIIIFTLICSITAFSPHVRPTLHHVPRKSCFLFANKAGNEPNNAENEDYLRKQLTLYLQKRQQMNADSAAKQQIGKVVGGTKGNAILEFVSGSPNKAYILDEAPDVFDYDELTTYGFDFLVEPIMEAGGRRAMYALMNMEEPPTPSRLKPKMVPKLVIDRTGETDSARYSGLKMTQTLDDQEVGQRLAEIQKMKKEGIRITRKKLVEDEFDIPFSDSRYLISFIYFLRMNYYIILFHSLWDK